MNGRSIYFALLWFFFLRASVCVIELNDSFFENGSEFFEDEDEVWYGNTKVMWNATIFKTVKKYQCSASHINNAYLLVYGAKSWTFPKQDVSLTLSHPPASATADASSENEQTYLISGVKVVLFIDGDQTRGYITSGGIMQYNIELTFEISDVTMLGYQFWLYGVLASAPNATEQNSFHYLC